MDDAPEENISLNGLDQNVTETIGIVVDLPNRADQRGQFASSLVDIARSDLFRCILNWRPDWANSSQGFNYAGGHLVHMDRERLHWQFDFSLKILITDEDGWQPPSDPIIGIEATLTDPESGETTPIGFTLGSPGGTT